MNIVLDYGVRLSEDELKLLSSVSEGASDVFILNPMTCRTERDLNTEDGITFITNLPNDVLRYHAEFFKAHSDAPQWVFILRGEHGNDINILKAAALEYNLKKCHFAYAPDTVSLAEEVKTAALKKLAKKGKTLLFAKRGHIWREELARILFGSDESKYILMNRREMRETDASILFICGTGESDFADVICPEGMEPYFIVNSSASLQHYINPSRLEAKLAEIYNMTVERVRERLFFVNIQNEKYLMSIEKDENTDAMAAGALIWDSFGLPVVRNEYTEENIKSFIKKEHCNVEKIKENIF